MGPHSRAAGEDVARTEEQLPGWEVWAINEYGGHRCYSARPAGATAAVPGCTGLSDLECLIDAVRKYESNLSEHIAQTRAELEDTPASWIGRRDMPQSRLTALETLAAAKAR